MMIMGRYLNIADGNLQVMQVLLEIGVLLGHFLVFAFPLAVGGLESLHLTLVVTSLDVGLAKPVINSISHDLFFTLCPVSR
jgi:hypothetical protein